MRRHALDPISLVFGAIFAGVGLTFLFGTIDLAALPPAWSWPIPLMIVGALIILLAVRRDRAYAPSHTAQQIAAAEPLGSEEPDDRWGTTALPADEPSSTGAGSGATPDVGTVNPPDGT